MPTVEPWEKMSVDVFGRKLTEHANKNRFVDRHELHQIILSLRQDISNIQSELKNITAKHSADENRINQFVMGLGAITSRLETEVKQLRRKHG